MIIHIVKENERIENILRSYNVSLDDIKVCNLHITDFSNIKPSTKLRIPSINSETIEILNQSEPLVSQYYEPSYEMEEEKVKESESQSETNYPRPQTPKFRGLNFIKPQGQGKLFNKSIYPHFIPKLGNKNKDK